MTKAPSILTMDPKSWRLYAIPWSVCSVVLDFPPLLLACATIARILKRLWRSCLSLFLRTHKPYMMWKLARILSRERKRVYTIGCDNRAGGHAWHQNRVV